MAYLEEKRSKKSIAESIMEDDFSEIINLYGFTDFERVQTGRKGPETECRQACCYALYKAGLGPSDIGFLFNKDHSTIISGIQRIEGFIDSYPEAYKPLKQAIENFKTNDQRK